MLKLKILFYIYKDLFDRSLRSYIGNESKLQHQKKPYHMYRSIWYGFNNPVSRQKVNYLCQLTVIITIKPLCVSSSTIQMLMTMSQTVNSQWVRNKIMRDKQEHCSFWDMHELHQFQISSKWPYSSWQLELCPSKTLCFQHREATILWLWNNTKSQHKWQSLYIHIISKLLN